jgi:hypothetical protein
VNSLSDLLSFAVIVGYTFELDGAYYRAFYNVCQQFCGKMFKKIGAVA